MVCEWCVSGVRVVCECCVSDGGYRLRAEGWLRVKGYQPHSLPKKKKNLRQDGDDRSNNTFVMGFAL